MAESASTSYYTDETLYLCTSLTAGSSHIITATSRLETILKANKIPFRAIDLATDENARKLWGRRAGGRKLPGLMRLGYPVGDLAEIEDWNEYGELKEKIGPVPAIGGVPATSTGPTPSGTLPNVPQVFEEKPKVPAGATPTAFTVAMKQAGEEAAQKASEGKAKGLGDSKSAAGEVSEPNPSTKEVDKVLDHSAVAPPPTGSYTASEAAAPETMSASPSAKRISIHEAEEAELEQSKRAVEPHAEAVLSSDSISATKPDPVSNLPIGTLQHRGSNVSTASVEEIKQIEDDQAIPEEDEEQDEEDVAKEIPAQNTKATHTPEPGKPTASTTTSHSEPGNTQTQAAADPKEAGNTVAD